ERAACGTSERAGEQAGEVMQGVRERVGGLVTVWLRLDARGTALLESLREPGCRFALPAARGLARDRGEAADVASDRVEIRCAPKTRAKEPTTALRLASGSHWASSRAWRPSRKPSRTPGVPSGGVLSKIAFTGPSALVTWPLSPSARQNGVS